MKQHIVQRAGHHPKHAVQNNPAIPKRRLWLFRLVAVTVLPIVLLVILEAILRLAGFGYPVRFFVPAIRDGQSVYVTNDRFGYRFFPPTIARTPFPLCLPATKPANTYRIFLFGESAAQGDPDPTFGVGRYLEVLLRERYPATHFEVVCVAMTAINSHAILPIARECARLQGDLWVIYMGNNEVVGPFGAGTVFGPQAPKMPLIRASLALKATRTGQLLERWIGKRRGNSAPPKTWEGLGMFKEHQLRHDDPGRARVYENFGKNLEDILRSGRKAGVPVVLSTMAVNLKDCAPFASLHKAGLDENQKAAWEQSYKAGVVAADAGDPRTALAAFSNAASIDPEFADLHFRMGLCELALTNTAGATRDFERARDFDALAFRADSRLNQIIVQAAARHSADGVKLVDAAEALAAQSSGGIAGEEYFYEHVHLNFDGNYALAKLFAGEIAKQLPSAMTQRATPEWASERLCERRLGVSVWDRYRVWQANYSRVSEAPFTDQLNDVPRAKRYMARLEQFQSEMTSDAQAEARNAYEEALALAPDDPSLHGNYAQFLGEIGELADAVKHQQRVCELLPQSPGALQKSGVLLMRLGDTAAAEGRFSSALVLRPDYVPAMNERGLILANRRNVSDAERCFLEAIRINPGYAESYVNLGFVKQIEGNLADALKHYEQAAQLQPDGPTAYFQKAIALLAEHRSAEALKLFEAAVWMNPSFWQARYLLGMELARAEKVAEAEAQFSQVVRLRPDFARGHVNLGVALAKSGKWDSALAEFEATLKLNPTNDVARRSIETIQSLKQRAIQQ